jgi:hypothetical protein
MHKHQVSPEPECVALASEVRARLLTMRLQRRKGEAMSNGDLTIEEKLALFDEATERQRQRDAAKPWVGEPPADRGWTREELYEDRGRPR